MDHCAVITDDRGKEEEEEEREGGRPKKEKVPTLRSLWRIRPLFQKMSTRHSLSMAGKVVSVDYV